MAGEVLGSLFLAHPRKLLDKRGLVRDVLLIEAYPPWQVDVRVGVLIAGRNEGRLVGAVEGDEDEEWSIARILDKSLGIPLLSLPRAAR